MIIMQVCNRPIRGGKSKQRGILRKRRWERRNRRRSSTRRRSRRGCRSQEKEINEIRFVMRSAVQIRCRPSSK